jgi:hypothetical protein
VVADLVFEFTKSKIDYLWGNLLFVDQDDTNKIGRKWKSKNLGRDDLYATHIPPHPCFFMKKHVVCSHPKFNIRYAIAADFDYMKNIILDPNLNGKYIDRYCVKMRLGGLSTSNNLIKQNLEIFESLKDTFPRYSVSVFVWLKLKNKLSQVFS